MKFVRSFLLIVLVLFSLGVAGEEEVPGIKEQSSLLDPIEKALGSGNYSYEDLGGWQKSISKARLFAQSCASTQEADYLDIKKALEGLGKAEKDEPVEVSSKRKRLEAELEAADQMMKRCKVLVVRTDELSNIISEEQASLLAERLTFRENNILELALLNLQNIDQWYSGIKSFVTGNNGFNLLNRVQWLALAILLFIGGLVGYRVQLFLVGKASGRFKGDGFAAKLSLALSTTAVAYLPAFLITVINAAFFFFATGEQRPVPIINIFAYGAPLVIVLLFSARFLFWPKKPATLFLDLSDQFAHRVYRRIYALVIVAFVAYVMIGMLLAGSFPGELQVFARIILVSIVVTQIVLLVRLVRRTAFMKDFNWALLLTNMVLMSALFAAYLGYHNLGTVVIRTVTGGLISWGVMMLLHQLFRSIFDDLDAGKTRVSKGLRKMFGVSEGNHVPGLYLVRIIVALTIWGGFILVIIKLLGVSQTLQGELQSFLVNGVTFGTIKIVPIRLLWGLLSFVALILLGSWVKSQMRRRWLAMLPLSSSSRETLLTLTGYIIYTFALVFALGMIGLDFSQLALIFGALSVGIGFGLQNIVSNFISGLILLFERPVRIGDWVVVGGIEGYVRKINIRATVIETFDMAEIIVPNSEFISAQVTNWTLASNVGRAVVPVGVAYGSDTEKVKQILLEVAESHPDVITNGMAPEPSVVFREFGDSSLNFQLRCFLRNVNSRLVIMSDLNFAIDKAFREAGIEIPFPQRDLHIRSDDTKPKAELPEPPENTEDKG